MKKFNAILYVTNGIFNETEGLKQAMKLVSANRLKLDVLLVYPALPKTQDSYADSYGEYLEEQLSETLEQTRQSLQFTVDQVPLHIVRQRVEIPPAIEMIRHVMKEGYDLVIKEAEPGEDDRGFRSTDMTLLRKCPSAVWLARPVKHGREKVRIAVAVDAETRDSAEKALSIRLLQLARSMADTFEGSLGILSCWDYELEQFLRYKAWANITEEEQQKNIQEAEEDHKMLLQKLIDESGIGEDHRVVRMRGEPDRHIPDFIKNEQVDILVMGTVARTGILGFLIGNTAENILNTISCSLMALKPRGFVSPVKPYP